MLSKGSVPFPRDPFIVDRGVEGGREYVVTVCTSMGEPTDYGYRHTEAFYDWKMRKARIRVKHFRGEAVEADLSDDARVDATAKTLRYAAGLVWTVDEAMAAGLYDAAKAIEATTRVEDWWCCPVCEETICDEGCPLEPLRRQAP